MKSGKELIECLKGSLESTKDSLTEHAPGILLGAGIVGGIATVVLACIATTKVGSIVDEAEEELKNIHENLPEEEIDKNVTRVYLKAAFDILKLYSTSIIIGAASTACIGASYDILNKQNAELKKKNAELLSAYASIHCAYNAYRERVKEKYGEEEEMKLHYDIKEEVDESDPEGKKTIDRSYYDGVSEYARFFDEASWFWEKDPEYNLQIVRAQQNYSNEVLHSRYSKYGVGFYFLNDAYSSLDIPITKAGQFVGWIYDPDHKIPNHRGDGKVIFGIYDGRSERKVAFVNGYERSILLDFNVDGVIADIVDDICKYKYKD